METLARLTRRQVDALRAVTASETGERGAPLGSIARALGISSPSALAHLTYLEQLDLVSRYRGKSRSTHKGRSALTEYQRHHRIAESLFSNLGLSNSEICRAAREVDLALSHSTIERICDAEGHPSECPHGAPIGPCRSTPRAG